MALIKQEVFLKKKTPNYLPRIAVILMKATSDGVDSNSRILGDLSRDKTYRYKSIEILMANEVILWCQSCDLCASRKPGPGFGKSPLQSSPHQSTKPFIYRISLNRNFLMVYVKTNNGSEYIIIVGDYFQNGKNLCCFRSYCT